MVALVTAGLKSKLSDQTNKPEEFIMLSTFLQIIVPLIIAALIGALAMRWWMKRWWEDVTESYENLRVNSRKPETKNALTKNDLDDRFASLSSSVASIPRTDLDPVTRRLSQIESTVAGLSFPETDLTPVYERMTRIDQRLAEPNSDYDRLEERLERLEGTLGEVSRSLASLQNTDLEPLQIRFNRLEQSLNEIDTTAPDVDLGPVHSGLAQLELAVSEIDLPQADLSPLQEQLTSLELRVVDLAEAIEDSRSEEYSSLNTELGSLSSSIAAMSSPDLDPMEQRLAGVERAVASIDIPEADLSSLHARIEQMEQRLLQPSADYQTLFARLAGMEAAVDALDRGPIDFSPVQNRLAALENLIAAVRADVHGIPSLEPIEQRLASLHQSIVSIPQPDLSSVVSSVRAVEARMDMAAMENRLTAIEYGLTAVHHMLRSRQNGPAPISQIEPELYANNAKPLAESRITTQSFTTESQSPTSTVMTKTYTVQTGTDPLASVRRPNDESNLLRAAAFGDADDLERISGVGPMLSDLLQDIGVYYFWQIAEWDAEDIVWVDNKLEHFKGRIERDNWVGQAQTFAAESDTANRPV